jgi:ABC-type lipoprotein export system ATPase subunit
LCRPTETREIIPKQRVVVARALVCSPKIVLADGPTGAFDSKSANEMMTLFGRARPPTGSRHSRHDVDVRPDLHLFVQLDDVGVVHAETAMRDRAADRAGSIGPVYPV